jgi:predicted dehydrogenase
LKPVIVAPLRGVSAGRTGTAAGCGFIGQKRARALAGAQLAVCADKDRTRAEQMARGAAGCVATTDWREAVRRPEVEMVVVATPHNTLAEIARGAIEAGKHVLLEKPAARHVAELRPLPALAEKKGVLARVGFNHRYHRSFREGRKLVDSGALGPLMFLRARYGHGGRVGYDKEWRAQPELSGGGELTVLVVDKALHAGFQIGLQHGVHLVVVETNDVAQERSGQ